MSAQRIRMANATAAVRELTIARYRAAYAAANGVECQELRYENGWVVGFTGGARDRYRVAELHGMTAALERRARATEEQRG